MWKESAAGVGGVSGGGSPADRAASSDSCLFICSRCECRGSEESNDDVTGRDKNDINYEYKSTIKSNVTVFDSHKSTFLRLINAFISFSFPTDPSVLCIQQICSFL